MVSLIRQFKLTPIKLSNDKSYIYKQSCSALIPDIDKFFNQQIKKVLKNDNYSKNETFYNHCLRYLSKKDVDHLMHIFGYYSEFKEMNAYDSIKIFTPLEI